MYNTLEIKVANWEIMSAAEDRKDYYLYYTKSFK